MKRIQSLYTIAKNGHIAAALFAVVLALAGFANADAMSSNHSHKGKKGSFTLAVATEVGGTILQPGNYEVKEINSASGPALEFVHLFWNELASELVQANEEEVVARVKFTEQALSSLPKKTELLLASNTSDAIGLQIRGNDVAYIIAAPMMSATSEAKPDCASNGMQE
jgi:hypothetical protein